MKTPQAGAVERSGLQSCIGDKDHIENTAPVDQVCYFFYSIFFCFISPDRLFLFFDSFMARTHSTFRYMNQILGIYNNLS